jgi:hypothetical protein
VKRYATQLERANDDVNVAYQGRLDRSGLPEIFHLRDVARRGWVAWNDPSNGHARAVRQLGVTWDQFATALLLHDGPEDGLFDFPWLSENYDKPVLGVVDALTNRHQDIRDTRVKLFRYAKDMSLHRWREAGLLGKLGPDIGSNLSFERNARQPAMRLMRLVVKYSVFCEFLGEFPPGMERGIRESLDPRLQEKLDAYERFREERYLAEDIASAVAHIVEPTNLSWLPSAARPAADVGLAIRHGDYAA